MPTFLLVLFGLLAFTTVVLLIAVWAQARSGKGKSPDGEKRTAPLVEEMRLPYRYAYRNLIVHDDGVWMGVKIGPHGSMHMDDDDVENYAMRAAQALQALVGSRDVVEVQYRLTRMPFDVDAWAAQLIDHAWNPTQMYKDYVTAQSYWLKGTGAAMSLPVLLVKIDTIDKSIRESIATSIDSAVIGGHDDGLPPELGAKWRQRADQVSAQLSALSDDSSPIEPLTRQEMLWLIRKPLAANYTPSLDDLPESVPWGEGEFQRWVDFVGTNRRTHIVARLSNSDVVGYQRDNTEEELKGYTTCLIATDVPKKMDMQQHGLFEDLSTYGCEVSYRMRVMPKAALVEQLRKVKSNIDGEVESWKKAHRISEGSKELDPLLAEESVDAEDAWTNARRPDTAPGMEYQLIVQVSAASAQELNMRVETLIAAVKNSFGITLTRTKMSWRLLLTMLPGNGDKIGASMGWRLGDTNLFGLSHPRVGVRAGNRVVSGRGGKVEGWVGDFIGMGGDTPIFDSPHANISRGAGAGVLVVGVSGGGKTNYALLKFFQDTESGVEGYAVDPKNDFASCVYYLAFGPQVLDPEFEEEANNGTLGQPGSKFQPTNPQFWADTVVIDPIKSNAGMLCPWQIADGDIATGAQMARTVFQMFLAEDVYKVARQSLSISIGNAIADYREAVKTYEQEHPGCTPADVRRDVPLPSAWGVAKGAIAINQQIVDDPSTPLESKTHYQYIVNELQYLLDAPASKVVFAPNPAGLRLGGYRRTVFTLMGISRPDPTTPREEWSEAQRFGAGAIYLLTRMVTRQMNGPRKPHRTTGLLTVPPRAAWVDESYVVSSFAEGRAFLQVALAQGRSLNFVLYLLDQNASRVAKIENSSGEESEASGNQLQSVYAFKQRRGQGEVVAKLMTTSNTDMVAQQVLSDNERGGQLATGRCLMRDMDMALALVDIELMFRPILDAADTTPTSRAISQSRSCPASPIEWDYIDGAERNEALERGELTSIEAEFETPEGPEFIEEQSPDDEFSETADGDIDITVVNTDEDSTSREEVSQ